MKPATRMRVKGEAERGKETRSACGLRRLWLLGMGAFLLLLLSIPMAGAAPSQAGVSWAYKLVGSLNQAQDPETSRTIVLTGSGSFDTSTSSINGGGRYTVLDQSGSVVGSGTWTATTFDSFAPTPLGGSPGQGGHLELEASFAGTGVSVGSAHVVIQCSMWGATVGPPGFPWPGDFVEAGSYTTHASGAVMFHLNQ